MHVNREELFLPLAFFVSAPGIWRDPLVPGLGRSESVGAVVRRTRRKRARGESIHRAKEKKNERKKEEELMQSKKFIAQPQKTFTSCTNSGPKGYQGSLLL